MAHFAHGHYFFSHTPMHESEGYKQQCQITELCLYFCTVLQCKMYGYPYFCHCYCLFALTYVLLQWYITTPLATAWHAYNSIFLAHIKARAKRKDLCVLSSSRFSRSRLNVALDSARVFWSCLCKQLMSGRQQIVSSINIDINTIRRSSSRRARQHKGKQSTEVNLWKRLM